MTVNDFVTITIDKAEALVLFDLLADFRDAPALSIRNDAGRATLWAVAACLEKVLTEPFMDDYGRILVEAQTQVVAKSGSSSRTPEGELNNS